MRESGRAGTNCECLAPEDVIDMVLGQCAHAVGPVLEAHAVQVEDQLQGSAHRQDRPVRDAEADDVAIA